MEAVAAPIQVALVLQVGTRQVSAVMKISPHQAPSLLPVLPGQANRDNPNDFRVVDAARTQRAKFIGAAAANLVQELLGNINTAEAEGDFSGLMLGAEAGAEEPPVEQSTGCDLSSVPEPAPKVPEPEPILTNGQPLKREIMSLGTAKGPRA